VRHHPIRATGSTRCVTATGSEAVPVAFGFHPYFRLPGLPRARWEVVFPVHERLPLDRLTVPTGATEPASALTGAVGERTWDDEFDCSTHRERQRRDG